jgi:hypothetical protein
MCNRPPRRNREPAADDIEAVDAADVAPVDEYRYTTNPDGTVDYVESFRDSVYACVCGFELMQDIFFPENGRAQLPDWWHDILDAACSLLNISEQEPLSTGDVCCHYHCQSLVRELANYIGECGELVHTSFPYTPSPATTAENQHAAVVAAANALLAVFAFAQHYLDADQCADRGIPQMVAALSQYLGSRVATFPGELAAALRAHPQHVWLHTFGTVRVEPLATDDLDAGMDE